MHPSDYELIRYARTAPARRQPDDPAAVHLQSCAECREELAIIEDWLERLASPVADAPAKSAFEELVISLLQPRPSRILFQPMSMPAAEPRPYALAADGSAVQPAGLQHRATLYSENPEVLLRIMHDPGAGRDFLQLTAVDASLTSRVYVHLAEPPMEFLTDEQGVAELPHAILEDPAALAWGLQFPDATFMLKPLSQPEAADESIIELPDGDKIAIQYVKNVSGLSLRVRPLCIHGRETMSQVRVVVCQTGGRWQVVDAPASGDCVAANLASDSPIEIRLFVIE